MGIPKFFRFISERWPTISQLIEGNQIPEFDNLYLDMNSILHNCTHSQDDSSDVTKRLSDEEIFAKIFSYINHLFMTIKPKSVFYMAIDGVAPRAKMNQQRARRFRSAMDAEKALNKAIEEGAEIPKGEPFDSNSITPGTEFMSKLTVNLKYFINEKITNDSNWRDVKVIFSGHEVPGEGEHKIMDFIRSQKIEQNYDPDTRHCIYGLDADLIMLGLSTHIPHFALLREEVTFGRRKNNANASLENQNFYLLHLSLLREYMELEIKDIADEMDFEYNFERILDDFILIFFVIGNDFLPNLPDLHLNKGAFPVLIQTFKEALLHLDGYINEYGKINFRRLKVWLNILKNFELMNFEQKDIDIDWFNKQLENISIEGERKRARIGKKLLLKQQKKLIGKIKPWLLKNMSQRFPVDILDENIPSIELNPMINDDDDSSSFDSDEDSLEEDEESKLLTPNEKFAQQTKLIKQNLDFLKQLAFDLNCIIVHSKSNDTYSLRIDVDSINPNETQDEQVERLKTLKKTIKRYQSSIIVESKNELDNQQKLYNQRFVDWKGKYYKEKFHFDSSTDEGKLETRKIAEAYIEGLQWVLFYYYRGCPSWSWYFPYHYAPRISDLILGLDQSIVFTKGTPFTPYQQLMAVLPERSKSLIPVTLRPLMYDELSPILDFYPHDVELDKNGKTADWEAVVLLSFIDENRLIQAMEPYLSKLSPEEKVRNTWGQMLTYYYNPQVSELYKSPLTGMFKDIEENHCVEKEYHLNSQLPQLIELANKHPENNKVILAGFPTLYSIPFDFGLDYNESLVFQTASRQQSMVLNVKNVFKETNLSLPDVAKRYLGRIVYTRWPYLRESKLLAITDGTTIFESDERATILDEDPRDRTSAIASLKNIKLSSRPMNIHEKKHYSSLRSSLTRDFEKKKAVHLGSFKVIVEVLPVIGLARNAKGAYVKNYANQSEYYPLQLMVQDVLNKDERYAEKKPQPIDVEFPINSNCIFLGDYAYGGKVAIEGYTSDTRLKLTVEKKTLKSEPMIGKERLKIDNELIYYVPSYIVSKKLKLHPLFLSKIFSKFLIANTTGKHVNVGIPIKFESRHEKVLGYARRNPKGWEFSNIAISTLEEYRRTFPDFFNKLSRNTDNLPSIQELFPSYSEEQCDELLIHISEWIKGLCSKFVTVSIESDSLSKASIAAVEDYIIYYSSQPEEVDKKHLAKVPREAILDPKASYSLLRSQKFDLGDRVVYIQDSGKVNLFSKGTVVGYTTLGTSLSVQVLFDHEIVSGNTFGGRLKTKRGIGLDASFLLNITNRQFIYHSKASKKAKEEKQTEKSRAAQLQAKSLDKSQNASKLLNHIRQKNPDNKKGKKEGLVNPNIIEQNTISYRDLIDKKGNTHQKTNKPHVKKDVNATSVYSAVLNQISTDSQPNQVPIHAPDQARMNGLPYHMPPNMMPPPIFPYPPNMPFPPQFNGTIPPQMNMQGMPYHTGPNMVTPQQMQNMNTVNEKGTAELKKFINGGMKLNSENKSKKGNTAKSGKKTILKRNPENQKSKEQTNGNNQTGSNFQFKQISKEPHSDKF